MNRKPRIDAKLKMLPEERQASIFAKLQAVGYVATLEWLKSDGFSTSLGALSEFQSWYVLRQQLARNESTVAQVLEDLKSSNPALSQQELDVAGQLFFSALAIQEKDSLTWKRIKDAHTKSEALKLAREEFEYQTCEKILKAVHDKETNRIVELNIPNEEKIRLLRKHHFADVDELEKSGAVKLPE
jgi:hypothetical protein